MWWLIMFIIVSLSGTQRLCPPRCECTGATSISCISLSSSELSSVITTLKLPHWNQIQELTIQDTPSISLDILPTMDNLEVLNLSGNKLKDTLLPTYLRFRSVRKLILENNLYTRAERGLLVPFPNIEEIHLGNNVISSFSYDSLRMPQMRIIRLNNNQIKTLGMHILRFMPQLHEVDISGNQLERLMISDFSDATSLRILNVSHNRIRTIECDTTTPMTALEILDLSANNLTTLPGSELRNMEGLRTLILKSNPIAVAGEGHLTLDNLQILDLSNITMLGVVEAGAFSRLPRLHTVFLHDNPELVYLSPRAFENISIFSLDISKTGLKSLEPTLLNNVAQVRLSGVPFDCRCLSEQLYSITTTTITDWVNATCTTRTGSTVALPSLSSTLFAQSDACRPNAIIPFGGKVEATVGETFKIYCAGSKADDIVKWRTPSGIVETGINPEFSTGFERLDYFTSTLFEPEQPLTTRKRAEATLEYYRLDVVLVEDEGDYECTVQRGKYSISRKIHLVVTKPKIELKVTHVGVSSVHLAWNQNINIQAVDRVALSVNSTSDLDFKRVVLLSLHNIYCSYNMINLLPDRVYNICLKWTITDNNTEIYSTCLSERTLKVRSLMEDLGVEGVIIICLVLTCLFLFFCGRCIYNRLHIYARAKRHLYRDNPFLAMLVLRTLQLMKIISFKCHRQYLFVIELMPLLDPFSVMLSRMCTDSGCYILKALLVHVVFRELRHKFESINTKR